MNTEDILVLLFCVATLIAIVVRRVRVPYTVALVLAGLAIGSLGWVEPPTLTRDMLFTFFLPGLLFEAAFHIDLEALRGTWRSVFCLSVAGVAVSVALTAGITLLARPLGIDARIDPWTAVIFGALVAATDPVAVTALFRDIGAPARLATLLEAESLFNDGTGVVVLTLVVALAASPGTPAVSAIPQFAIVAGGGAVVGIAVGWAVTRLIHRVDDPMIEIALTMVAALGAFVLADRYALSGVIATVVAGIVCAAHGRDTGMAPASRLATETFWRYVGFALNSIVFLLMGFNVRLSRLADDFGVIILGFLAMTIARFAVVGLLHLAFRHTDEAMPRSWSVILAWGGLRGALAMVLAFSLPSALHDRSLLVSMTVGAVILSLVVQGLTMPSVVRRLLGGVVGTPAPAELETRIDA